MKIESFRDWFDLEIALRDASVDPQVRPTRRAIANLSLGVGIEDAYYAVRELREAIMLINDGDRAGRKKLASIVANACDDFQRAIYYALAGRGVVLVIEDLLWLEDLLKARGEAYVIERKRGGRMMPLLNPYVAAAPDGPLPLPDPDFELGPSWYLDAELAG